MLNRGLQAPVSFNPRALAARFMQAPNTLLSQASSSSSSNIQPLSTID